MDGEKRPCFDPALKRFGLRDPGTTPNGPNSWLKRFAARGARMFKSKLIGWITATTLLCVAGVAIACRLSDSSGDLVQASAAWPSPDDKTPPPPAPKEATSA